MMSAEKMAAYLRREYEEAQEEVITFSWFGGNEVLMQLQDRVDYLFMILNDMGIVGH